MSKFNRPDTAAFWALSEILIDLDAVAEKFGLEAAIDNAVDVQTLMYVAQQRAFRALQIETLAELESREEEINKVTAAWMDAFIAGTKYGKKLEKDK